MQGCSHSDQLKSRESVVILSCTVKKLCRIWASRVRACARKNTSTVSVSITMLPQLSNLTAQGYHALNAALNGPKENYGDQK